MRSFFGGRNAALRFKFQAKQGSVFVPEQVLHELDADAVGCFAASAGVELRWRQPDLRECCEAAALLAKIKLHVRPHPG